jgi:hypothetical protein
LLGLEIKLDEKDKTMAILEEKILNWLNGDQKKFIKDLIHTLFIQHHFTHNTYNTNKFINNK